MSTGRWEDPGLEDLTARARIREAAIRLFAERGAGRATIRDIARAAGVSGGLVRHHFGSKDELRATCDAYVLRQMIYIKQQAVLEGRIGSLGFLSTEQPAMLTILRYVARSMVEGSPSADSMFEEMVGLGEDWLRAHHPGQMQDPRAYAALLVAMELGALSMRQQLSRALGPDILEPEGQLRLARAKVDFYSRPLLDHDLAARAHAAIDQLQRRQRSVPRRRPSTPQGAAR